MAKAGFEEMMLETHRIFIVVQVAWVLSAYQKYCEFKDFTELLEYKRAIEQAKESFHKSIFNYRIELVRPGKMRKQGLFNWKGAIFVAWSSLFFVGIMSATFGSMLENERLILCGCYVMFDLAYESVDAGMCWLERRLPLYLFAVEFVYSENDKKAEPRDENGRELP